MGWRHEMSGREEGLLTLESAGGILPLDVEVVCGDCNP